ncbi:uncharacterized protein ARMOST_20747 [Armillaria ostoyae]|uniref:Uncharacterized protein n=1 Tax=Armillaria ostoyae TaxID=47428 RepID=A0A284S850_ARMOS|nr:uncharacterized protein ARMOST_20747 [Armillaria ostoyae]
MSSSPSLDEYDIYGPDCIGPRPTRDSSITMEPQMVNCLRSLIPRYLRAIAEDDLVAFWAWVMPQWEKRFPQCFTYPYQPEYRDSYRRWQTRLEDWLDTEGGGDCEKFLNTPSVKSTSASASSQVADDEASNSVSSQQAADLVIDRASATSSDLEHFGRVSVYSEVPGECVLKRDLSNLRAEVEKWRAAILPTLGMDLQTWIKLVTTDQAATDAAT